MSTYSQLQSDIAAWINRSDLTVQIQTFIRIAEQKINRQLRTLQQEAVDTQALSAVSRLYPLPTRFISARNIYIDVVNDGRSRKLSYVTPIIMTMAAPSSDGYPSMYTIVQGQIQLDSLSADVTKNLIIDYFESFEELSVTNTSNWLTLNAYDVLLYSSIIEAEIYLYNETRTPILESKVQIAIDEINLVAEEGRYGGDNLRQRAT